MSDPVSPLDGRRHDGAIRLSAEPAIGMISLKGDLAHPDLGRALADEFGLAVPALRAVSSQTTLRALWMAPDELLLLLPRREADARADALQDRLSGAHMTAVAVSDARVVISLDGGGIRDVLTKLAPVDLRPAHFSPGMVRRTRLAQIAAAVWFENEAHARLVCFRSVADYAWALLCDAADPDGRFGRFTPT